MFSYRILDFYKRGLGSFLGPVNDPGFPPFGPSQGSCDICILIYYFYFYERLLKRQVKSKMSRELDPQDREDFRPWLNVKYIFGGKIKMKKLCGLIRSCPLTDLMSIAMVGLVLFSFIFIFLLFKLL